MPWDPELTDSYFECNSLKTGLKYMIPSFKKDKTIPKKSWGL